MCWMQKMITIHSAPPPPPAARHFTSSITEDGHVYYVDTETNESFWTMPEDGILLNDQVRVGTVELDF